MQLTCREEAVFEISEHQVEDNSEGAMETPDRIGKRARMLGDGGGDPRVRQLKQQGAAGTEEARGLAVNAPDCRLRTKHAGARIRRGRPHPMKLALQAFGGDDLGLRG